MGIEEPCTEEHSSKQLHINASASEAPQALAENHSVEIQGLPVKECSYACPSKQDLCALSPINNMKVVLLSYAMDNG